MSCGGKEFFSQVFALTLSRQRHGKRMDVQRQTGNGSAYHVLLPIHKSPKANTPKPANTGCMPVQAPS